MAHTDTFVRDALPPRELWPDLSPGDEAGLDYPEALNAAVELLDVPARAHGDRTALVFPGGSWSYARLLAEANRVAWVLTRDLGVEPGNRVLLHGPNAPTTVAAWFGILKAGGVVVCTMPLLRSRELAYVIGKARVTHALVDHRIAEPVVEAVEARAADGGSPLHTVVRWGDGADDALERRAAAHPDTFDAVRTSADDPALIAFTSGTTGDAKGTVHVHRDLLAVCDTFSKHVLHPRPDDLFCGSPPLAFTFGLGALVLFPMRAGAAALLLEKAPPPDLLEGIREYGATLCFTAPTAYRAMLPEARAGGVGRLRACVSAGETLPRATFEAWEEATGIRIIDGIGATEMLHIFIAASGDDIRPGSTGRTVPGYRARVVDDDGTEVPRGTVGRLAVRGPTGCRYLDDPERQRTYVRDGWNLTGDSYVQDEDGWFWYQARSDDMIVSAGYNIAGPEVEAVLLEHPAVVECGVIGVPDPDRGHVVKAVVVLADGVPADDDTVEELQDFVKSQIAPYKYPRRVEFVDALPRTLTGKLQRFRLRDGHG